MSDAAAPVCAWLRTPEYRVVQLPSCQLSVSPFLQHIAYFFLSFARMQLRCMFLDEPGPEIDDKVILSIDLPTSVAHTLPSSDIHNSSHLHLQAPITVIPDPPQLPHPLSARRAPSPKPVAGDQRIPPRSNQRERHFRSFMRACGVHDARRASVR